MALAEADFAPFPTTVLIADDDTSVRRLLRIAFEMDGYRTITAADGDEAVAAAPPPGGRHDRAPPPPPRPRPAGRGPAGGGGGGALSPPPRHYGFARGESLVGGLADLLLEQTRVEPEGLAGRLGAQDFIALVEPA